jgi:hypothetical protein
MEKSTDYIHRCVEIITADKNISEHTITLMFLEYGKLLEYEKRQTIKNKLNSKK